MNRTIISLILTGGILLASCAPKEKPAGAAAAGAADSVAVIPVKVMPVTKTKIARTIDYTATVQAYEEVNLAPSTPAG